MSQRAEATTAPSRDELDAILDSSPAGVAITSVTEGTFLYVNPGMAAFFGLTRDEMLGRPPVSFFVDPEDRAKAREALSRHGEIRKFRVRNRMADGSERPSFLSSRLINYNGAPAILTWIEDEAERDRREQEIISASKQVELLHHIAGTCNRAVNFYDALRNGTAEIARCLGWPVGVVYRRAHGEDEVLQLSSMWLSKERSEYEFLRGALVGRSFHAGEDVPGRVLATREVVWTCDIAGDPGITRFSADDPVRMISALGLPIVVDDAVIAVLELLNDRSVPRDERVALTLVQVGAELGRVHLRDQMTVALQEARAEAESSARAKASFLAAMSHEVRTPMNGVVGMVDLVLRTKLDDEQRFMLQTVKELGHALIKVINDILDFSKIEAGRLEIEHGAFSVTKVVEAVGLSLAPIAAKKKLALITFVDPRIPDAVLGDAVRVNQILSNLGANAVKFSTTGEVVIKAELISPPATNGRDSRASSARVRFSVSDEGVGIAAESLGRLFEEFQQADTSTTRRFGGTGLGLAICKRLTALMDGEITVSSMLGVGSEFTCELPFGLPGQPAPESASADLAGLRVLVIAESEALREACDSYIAYWKAEVASVPKLRDAMAYLKTATEAGKAIDIVVIPQPVIAAQAAALQRGLSELPRRPRLVLAHAEGEAGNADVALSEATWVEVNPLRRTALITAVAVAAGRASPETHIVEQPETTEDAPPPSVAEALEQGRLILVAEDHVANQDVLRRQLNRSGYACEIAEDGAAALALWRSKKYALVLTDCHMPNMDGFGLTAEIRKAEAGTGGRVPIVAITANVLQGEAERCLAAGMDAFLPKPLELVALRAVLTQFIGGAKHEDAGARTETRRSEALSAPTLAVLDLGRIRDAFGSINDEAREYFGVFMDSVDPLLAKFEEELAGARFMEARETIHKARGATANAGGCELAAIMQDVEIALMKQDYEGARKRSLDMRPAWERLTQAIARA